MEKAGCALGNKLPDARNNIPKPKWDLLLHIARQPKGRMVPSLLKSVAQRHDLLALQSSGEPIHSHKMAAAPPDTHPHLTMARCCHVFLLFIREKDLS